MRRTRAAIVTGASVLILGLTATTAAHAITEYVVCAADGDVLTTGTRYVVSGTGWYVTKHQMTVENDADQNNLAARLRHRDNSPLYWAWTSGDNIRGGTTYVRYPNTQVPKPAEMNTNFVAEQFGNDPSCNAQIQLDGVDQ